MRRLALLFLSALLIPLSAAHAAITPQIERQATALMDAGRPQEALALLRRAHEPASAGPQQWFVLGLAAHRARDLATAEMAFRAVLARDPASARARLELARVLQERGAKTESERLFLEVRSLNPPAPVLANIDRFLALLRNRDETGQAWRARATVGLGYDSNVNQGTRAQQVPLFGLPFQLSREARQRSDGFAFFKGELDHVARFDPNWAWATSLSFTARRNFKVTDYDSYGVDVATGPILQPSDRVTIVTPLFMSVRRFENSQLRSSQRFYSNEFGIAPQLRFAATPMIGLNLTGIVSRKHYFENAGQDAWNARLAAGPEIRTGAAGTVSANLTGGRETANMSIYSKRVFGVNFGWQYAFAENLAVSVQAAYERSAYDEREIFNDRTRVDRRTSAGLDAIWSPEMIAGDLILSYAYTYNQSNLALYEYQRHLMSLAYRKTF